MPDEMGKELLIRLDERLKSIQVQFDTFGTKLSAEIDHLKRDLKEERENTSNSIENLRDDLKDTRDYFEEKYVTKAEFAPIKKAVWAAIGLIVSGVLSAAGSILFAVKH